MLGRVSGYCISREPGCARHGGRTKLRRQDVDGVDEDIAWSDGIGRIDRGKALDEFEVALVPVNDLLNGPITTLMSQAISCTATSFELAGPDRQED